MTALEREIERQRAQLLAAERRGLAEVARGYEAVLRDLNARLAAATKQITEARAAGVVVNEAWLARQVRFQALVTQHEQATLQYLRSCLSQVEGTKSTAVGLAQEHTPKLAVQFMGPAPAEAQVAIAKSFQQLPAAQIERLVHNAADDRPLGSLLLEVAPQSSQALKDAMFSGVARGAGVADRSGRAHSVGHQPGPRDDDQPHRGHPRLPRNVAGAVCPRLRRS